MVDAAAGVDCPGYGPPRGLSVILPAVWTPWLRAAKLRASTIAAPHGTLTFFLFFFVFPTAGGVASEGSAVEEEAG